MADFVVRSKVHEYLKSKGVNVAGDAVDGLDAVVKWHLDKAVERTQANGRKTVRPVDF